ncbi:MAG: methyltransferase domain-containing protein [Candidatus Eiseniibacteriota bacterium]|jgi:2-polyprenyl-3-methyl-5-hydroxy-6-metoxy-1,4-benzoquinol methylase
MDLSQRCHDAELMDDVSITGPRVERALAEIATVNRLLGGISTSLAGLRPFLAGRRQPVRVLDVGTGGADIPLAIASWCRRERIPIRIVAIDVGADACRIARARTRDAPEVEVCRADVFALPFPPRSFHLAHCAMVLHHFTQSEIARILTTLATIVTEGIVINDLRRHPVAYHGIRLLTRIFSRSRLVRNDAPLSVRRGFQAADLDDLRDRCGFSGFRYRHAYAYRYLCEVALGPDDIGPREGARDGDRGAEGAGAEGAGPDTATSVDSRFDGAATR